MHLKVPSYLFPFAKTVFKGMKPFKWFLWPSTHIFSSEPRMITQEFCKLLQILWQLLQIVRLEHLLQHIKKHFSFSNICSSIGMNQSSKKYSKTWQYYTEDTFNNWNKYYKIKFSGPRSIPICWFDRNSKGEGAHFPRGKVQTKSLNHPGPAEIVKGIYFQTCQYLCHFQVQESGGRWAGDTKSAVC